MPELERGDRIRLTAALVAGVLTGALTVADANAIARFAVAAVALAALASIVGLATEQIGERLGPGATGLLQAAFGNLPELFFAIFALRAGLVAVVQSALVGSILANSLLVLGLAILVGGLRHGTQRFDSAPPRMIAILTLLSVAALAVPTLAHGLHTPADRHGEDLSVACAIILLAVFAVSIPASLGDTPAAVTTPAGSAEDQPWPLWTAALLLAFAALGAAFVSDWFVEALRPAMKTLQISDAFAGLVIVAIAGNAVENVVGIQLAARNRPDYALSVIMNSSLQIALGLIPVLVLLSFALGSAHLTLVLPPLLLTALTLAAVLGAFIVYDGESIWLEGVALVGLYGIVAAAFWWG